MRNNGCVNLGGVGGPPYNGINNVTARTNGKTSIGISFIFMLYHSMIVFGVCASILEDDSSVRLSIEFRTYPSDGFGLLGVADEEGLHARAQR